MNKKIIIVGLGWVKKFVTNPMGTFTNIVLDVIREIADAIQMLINLIQTVPLGVYDDWTVKYSADDISDIKNNDEINQYLNVNSSASDTDNDKEYKLSVEINDTDGSEYMFEDTSIPIMYVDFYTMALNKVGALDVNFLSVDSSHDENGVWMSIRNLVSSIVLVSFYIASIILIMALIWYGVKIVSNSINPYQKAQDKDALVKLEVGVIMLIGTIVIMALSIYAYQAVLGEIYDDDSNEFPIRVHFNQEWSAWLGLAGNYDEDYSFSTSFTGYIRFMAEIENPDRCMQKAGYVIAYVVLVLMNVIILVIMLIRTLVMWVLAIVGPILAAIYAVTSSQRVMSWYKSWAFVYIIFALIQVIFAAVCVVLVNVMQFE